MQVPWESIGFDENNMSFQFCWIKSLVFLWTYSTKQIFLANFSEMRGIIKGKRRTQMDLYFILNIKIWTSQFVHFQQATKCVRTPNSDNFQFWQYPILTISNSDNFQFWQFPILTISNSDNFQFWQFPILTISNSDNLQFWQFPILNKKNLVVSNYDNLQSPFHWNWSCLTKTFFKI